MQQRMARQIGGRAQRLAPVQQRGRRDRLQIERHQMMGDQAGPHAGAGADREIDAVGGEIREVRRHVEIDQSRGIRGLEAREARYQPAHGEELRGADGERAIGVAGADTARRLAQQIERAGHGAGIALPRRREPHRAHPALEQQGAEDVFQRLDAVAHRRGRQVQLGRRLDEAAGARGGVEHAEGIERGQVGHGG